MEIAWESLTVIRVHDMKQHVQLVQYSTVLYSPHIHSLCSPPDGRAEARLGGELLYDWAKVPCGLRVLGARGSQCVRLGRMRM